jgi:hypothetical protein
MNKLGFEKGQKVEFNGNKECIIIRQYSAGTFEVRVWSGTRHVGDVAVSSWELKKL